MLLPMTTRALLGVAVLVSCTGVQAGQKAVSDNRVLVKDLLTEVQLALVEVQDEADEIGLPKLNSVILKLSTMFVKGGGGKINLYIVSFGTNISAESVQTLTVKLTPPKPGTPVSVGKRKFH